MPDNGPPAGYHEVPAPSQGGPPPGYHEVSAPQGEGFAKSFGATLPGYHEDDPFGALKDLWSGAKEMVSHPVTSASLVGHSIVDPMQETYEAGSKRFAQPGAGNKIAGAAEWLESGIPMLGPMLAKAGHQFEGGDVGGGLGTTAGAALPMIAPSAMEGAAGIPSKVGALASKAGEVPRVLGQKALGVGPELTEKAIGDRQALIEKTGEKYRGKLEAVQQANESARQTAVEKQQLQTEALGHAKEVSDHLTELKEHEKAFGKSLYPEIEGTADAKEMQGRLQNAIDSNIRGTDKPPAALTRIVKELEPEDPLAQASVFRGAGSQGRALRGGVNLSDLPDAARAKILSRLSPEERGGYEAPEVTTGKPLDFEQMHGYYSELGEELGRDLSGDERAAVTAARAELLGEMRKMAESQGKLSQFTSAQKNWSKYENTFNKTWSDKRGVASPIAKALNLKDPVTGEMLPERVAKVLGKDENYKLAQQMLGRYDAAKPELLQLMKEKMDHAGGMPKTMKQIPLPSPPAEPAQVDPRATKAAALKSIAEGSTISKPSRFEMWFPPLLLKRRLEGLVLNNPKLQEWLSQPREADYAKLKPSQVYPTKAAALAARKK